MKILHFMPLFDPDGRGGTEIFVQTLAREQRLAGHEASILCPNTEERLVTGHSGGLPVTRFPFPYGYRNKAFLEGEERHRTCEIFDQIVRHMRPDALHLHGLYPHFLPFVASLTHWLGFKPVLTIHLVNVVCAKQTLITDDGLNCDLGGNFRRCFKCVTQGEDVQIHKRLLGKAVGFPLSLLDDTNPVLFRLLSLLPAHRRVDATLRTLTFIKEHCLTDVLSPWFLRFLTHSGFKTDRISSFHYPSFEANTFVKDNEKYGSTSLIKFLFVGRVVRNKGAFLFLNSLKHIRDIRNSFEIRFVGRWDDSVFFKKVSQLQHKGYHVELIGEVDHAALSQYYRQSDYLIFPSLRRSGDMLPLVVQEAFNENLPVIASDTPFSRALIHENLNGRLFRADDENDLARVMREIVEHRQRLNFAYLPSPYWSEDRLTYYTRLYGNAAGGRSD